MAEHSPTPWAIAEVRTSCGRCFKIGSDEMLNEAGKPTYICVYDDYGYGDNAQRANAAFIVRACNSHDALVKALEDVIRDIKEYERANNLAPNPGRTECWDSVAYAKAVLISVALRPGTETTGDGQ